MQLLSPTSTLFSNIRLQFAYEIDLQSRADYNDASTVHENLKKAKKIAVLFSIPTLKFEIRINSIIEFAQ